MSGKRGANGTSREMVWLETINASKTQLGNHKKTIKYIYDVCVHLQCTPASGQDVMIDSSVMIDHSIMIQ